MEFHHLDQYMDSKLPVGSLHVGDHCAQTPHGEVLTTVPTTGMMRQFSEFQRLLSFIPCGAPIPRSVGGLLPTLHIEGQQQVTEWQLGRVGKATSLIFMVLPLPRSRGRSFRAASRRKRNSSSLTSGSGAARDSARRETPLARRAALLRTGECVCFCYQSTTHEDTRKGLGYTHTRLIQAQCRSKVY